MNIPFCRALNEDSIETLVQSLGHHYYEEGQIIIKEGQIIDDIYILDEGQVSVFFKLNQDETPLETLSDKGTVIGAMSFLTKDPATFNVRASSDCFFYVIKEDRFAQARDIYLDIESNVNQILEYIKEDGMPLFDYLKIKPPNFYKNKCYELFA